MDLARLLEIPGVYDCFQHLSGGVRCRRTFVQDHIKPKAGDKVLDIGCGTGDMLHSFPGVEYHGFDPSQKYIERARQRKFPNSHFTCGTLTEENLIRENYFDIVHSSGVLHHLNDEQAVELIRVAHRALKSGGKFYTLDGCFYPGQSRLAKLMLELDRGKFVRDQTGYNSLAKKVFQQIELSLYPRLLRPLPYPVLVMEMTKVETFSTGP